MIACYMDPDHLCPECEHRAGDHQAVSNPDEFGMDYCTVFGCGCRTPLHVFVECVA